jgi:hypothetical protein
MKLYLGGVDNESIGIFKKSKSTIETNHATRTSQNEDRS